MRFFTSLLLFLGIGSGLHVFAGTTDPNTPDSKYVEFGRKFPGVVRLRAKMPCQKPSCPEKEHTYSGSAVVIKPHWILTAAHVLAGTHTPVAIKDDGTEYPLAPYILHGDFDDDKIGYNDVALAYSPKDFELEFYTPLYTDDNEVGKAITIAGYGVYGTFHTGANKSDNKKRAGHNVIDRDERAILICSPSVGSRRLPLEFMIAQGDSGGGMFIGDKLAGINSFLISTDSTPDGSYNDESAFTRVSRYTKWVQQEIEKYELARQTGSQP